MELEAENCSSLTTGAFSCSSPHRRCFFLVDVILVPPPPFAAPADSSFPVVLVSLSAIVLTIFGCYCFGKCKSFATQEANPERQEATLERQWLPEATPEWQWPQWMWLPPQTQRPHEIEMDNQTSP
ncbi:hypothetical protein LguiB_024225 [Lonicera macranthoides]